MHEYNITSTALTHRMFENYVNDAFFSKSRNGEQTWKIRLIQYLVFVFANKKVSSSSEVEKCNKNEARLLGGKNGFGKAQSSV